MLGEAVDPYTRRSHGFPEAEFDARTADVLAVHGAYRFDDARYRGVLAESVACSTATAFFDIDFDYTPKVLKLVSQLLLRDILL